MLEKQLLIPEPANLPGTTTKTPYYLVGDAAFPLGVNLMRPYAGNDLNDDKEYFNRRLSRARRTIENAFGILCARWRILLTTLKMLPANVEKIVLCCIALHNFLRMNNSSKNTYVPDDFIDHCDRNGLVQGTWRDEINNLPSLLPSRNRHRYGGNVATKMRDTLKDFLYTHKI